MDEYDLLISLLNIKQTCYEKNAFAFQTVHSIHRYPKFKCDHTIEIIYMYVRTLRS